MSVILFRALPTLLVCLLAVAALGQEENAGDGSADARAWLSRADREWLSDFPLVRHGVVRGHEPFEFAAEEGAADGLTSDYMKIIEQRLGVRFEPVVVADFAELSREMRLCLQRSCDQHAYRGVRKAGLRPDLRRCRPRRVAGCRRAPVSRFRDFLP